ncbi:hypothetical protein MNBD_GAMMA23-361 [hydrothermal vent metagenome]|uniref:Glycosyltransferase 2-like domain-containing protein n=1 Tax=hydrothermal vent metagenome TaxID=652676 RepID=A0A3B0ZY04_9ZZZZ
MNNKILLSVIIGVQYAQDNLDAILLNLNPAAYVDVEFLFCATDADPDTLNIISAFNNCHLVTCKNGRLIPEMWGDGIKVAKSEKVALSTAHCIPAKNWVDILLATDMEQYPGVGGAIENDATSSPKDWAIFFLRYISFSPPQQSREIHEIAADNAVYRRDDILEHDDLLAKGFWEPSFHSRFRNKGMALFLSSDLVVTHRNCYTAGQFFKQRLAHGKEFGLARVREISTVKRLLLIVLSPALPILFLKKIILSVKQHGAHKSKLLMATPWLLVFLLAWGLGEARGYLSMKK